MRARIAKIGAGLVLLAGLAGGGAAWATAGDDEGDRDELVSGPAAERARAAALAHVGDGTITGVEREEEGEAVWEVEVARPDGSTVEVQLDAGYAVVGSGDEEDSDPVRRPAASARLDPARFSATVDHPLVPLSSIRLTVLAGSERTAKTGETVRLHVESRVLARTARVAGVPVAVVEVRDFEDGELVERTLDYYAQRDDGSVWYFGERVDDLEDGKVVGHAGQWLAGRGNAEAGLFMPAKPKVGDAFEQERAPGVAEDRSTVVATGLTVKTPAGRFSGCIRTRDFAPLDHVTEHKVYCRGVGLVREEPPGGRLELVRYR
jgi:hypothetical protein